MTGTRCRLLLPFCTASRSNQPSPCGGPATAALFDFRSEDRARQQIASLDQGGIALPDRDLYLSTDERSRILRDRFRDHVQQVFTMLGLSSDKASAGARAVLAIETALASASADVLGQRALDAHRISLAALQALTPHFDWTGYLAAASAPAIADVDVTVAPAFLQVLATVRGTSGRPPRCPCVAAGSQIDAAPRLHQRHDRGDHRFGDPAAADRVRDHRS